MKLISWNVNGLRACAGKGFGESFKALDADVVCLQETKMQAGQLDLEFDGYESYWNYADKKGYSGTAIYTRIKPLSVSNDIGIDEHDHEGRVITMEFDDFYLVCVYVPNSQDELKRLTYRMKWEDDFRSYASGLAEKKGVVICGDLNVRDRGKFNALLDAGFVDSWRMLNPDTVKYSWWSYRFKARERNAGWRIDYFIVSESMKDRISGAEIHNEIFGSDHCPVELDLK